MTILYRLKRLIQSDVHALLENLEEPEFIVAQSLRDMQDELHVQSENLKKKIQEQKESEFLLQQLVTATAEVEKKIVLAINEKREEAARYFIRKQIVQKKNQEQLQKEVVALRDVIQNLAQDLHAKQKAFDEISEKAKEMAQNKTSQSVAFACAPQFGVSDQELEHEVELEWLQRMKTVAVKDAV